MEVKFGPLVNLIVWRWWFLCVITERLAWSIFPASDAMLISVLSFIVLAFITLLFYPSLDTNTSDRRTRTDYCISESYLLLKVNYLTLKSSWIDSFNGKPFIFLWKCKANICLLLIECKFVNRLFPSSAQPPFQSEAKCKVLLWKSVFIHIEIRTNYHNKNFARLALKERLRGTRKWPICRPVKENVRRIL